MSEAPGLPYDYHFFDTSGGEGFILSKLIPNNSFQEEDVSLAPASWPKNQELEWNPPGHGDIYTAMTTSGILDHLPNLFR